MNFFMYICIMSNFTLSEILGVLLINEKDFLYDNILHIRNVSVINPYNIHVRYIEERRFKLLNIDLLSKDAADILKEFIEDLIKE